MLFVCVLINTLRVVDLLESLKITMIIVIKRLCFICRFDCFQNDMGGLTLVVNCHFFGLAALKAPHGERLTPAVETHTHI